LLKKEKKKFMTSSNKITLRTRRTFMLSSAMFLLATSNALSQSQTSTTIRFGLTPVFLNDDIHLLSVIKNYLESATGYSVELVTRRTYQEVTSLLVSGQIDAAWICGYPFVKFQNELDLLAVPEWNGEPLYQSYLITKFDREASKLADLKGDIHAFSDPDSNSGYLVTKALLQENGLSAESFFKKTLFTYSHRNVIRAVASGLVQSGSVDGYVWEVIREIDPDLVAGTKIVRKSDWFGFPPIAVSKRFAQTKKVNALKLAFLSSSEAEAGRAMLDYLRLTGFVNAKPALYDSVKRNVDRLGALL
jgi:phosphonate transport system substrate-binding protein